MRNGGVMTYDGDMETYRSLLLEERGARTSERRDEGAAAVLLQSLHGAGASTRN